LAKLLVNSLLKFYLLETKFFVTLIQHWYVHLA